jgi:hypothetical protein
VVVDLPELKTSEDIKVENDLVRILVLDMILLLISLLLLGTQFQMPYPFIKEINVRFVL